MDAMPLTISQELDAALDKLGEAAKASGSVTTLAFDDAVKHIENAHNKIQLSRCELLGEMEKL